MPKEKITKAEAVDYLNASAKELQESCNLQEALEILSRAGGTVGYAPAFRCLVKGVNAEQAIKWN